jgi:hypothetical protein
VLDFAVRAGFERVEQATLDAASLPYAFPLEADAPRVWRREFPALSTIVQLR